jgi:hypothetical protein
MVALTLMLRLFRGPSGAVLFMLVGLTIFGCQCGNPVPQNDVCNSPENTGVDALELGPGGEGAFRAFTADEKLTPVRGGQGASMLTFRLRAGPKPAQCMSQSTKVTSAFDPAEPVATLETPLSTYDDPSGKRATKTMYLIGSFGGFPTRVKVVTTVGSTHLEQSFALDGNNSCAAIANCQQTCVTACDQCATGASAAAVSALETANACVAQYCDVDGGRPDPSCRNSVIQSSTQCQSVWDTCQSTP